jgi:cytochrome b subunit of formate dehydrogenase
MSDEGVKPKVYQVNPHLRKVARASAIAILVGIVVIVITGWGITQTGVIYNLTHGLIDRGIANAIHRGANAPLAFFFLLHVLINVKIVVSQHHPSRAWLTNSLLIALGAGLMAAMVYMEYFRLGG